jgi:hypothetical protein
MPGPQAPQPAAATAVAQQADPGDWGFDLAAGERVLWGRRRSYGSDKAGLWFLGIFFAPLLFGFYFIYKALTLERTSPRLLAVTNQRMVVIEGDGSVTSHWLGQFEDLFAQRAQGQARGGGLIGAAIGAAIVAGMNALANRNEKVDPRYWARTIGIVLKGRDGKDAHVAVRPEEASVLGPTMARIIFLGEASVAGMVCAPPGTLMTGPRGPSSGQDMLIGGWLLLLLSSAAAFLALPKVVPSLRLEGFGVLAMAVLLLAGSAALLAFGSRRSWRLAESTGKKPNKVVSIAFPAGYFFLASVAIFGTTGYHLWERMVSSERLASRPKPSAGPTAAAKAPVPASTLPTTGGALSPASIDVKLRTEGYRFPSGKDVEKDDFDGAPAWAWFMEHATRPMAWVKLHDFTTDQARSAGPTAYAVSSSQAVAVRLTHTGATMDAARSLASTLSGKPLNSGARIVAALAAAGWRLADPIEKDPEHTFGHRTYLVFAKKGTHEATVHVLDFSKAASGQDKTAARVVERRVLLVSAGSSTDSSLSQEIARKLTGP